MRGGSELQEALINSMIAECFQNKRTINNENSRWDGDISIINPVGFEIGAN